MHGGARGRAWKLWRTAWGAFDDRDEYTELAPDYPYVSEYLAAAWCPCAVSHGPCCRAAAVRTAHGLVVMVLTDRSLMPYERILPRVPSKPHVHFANCGTPQLVKGLD